MVVQGVGAVSCERGTLVTARRLEYRSCSPVLEFRAALEATHGQMDDFFRQLLFKCHLEEVTFVGFEVAFVGD